VGVNTLRILIAVTMVALCAAPGAAQAAAKSAKAAKAAADTSPPKITHTPVDEAPAGKALTVNAKITDESEIFEPTLYYRQAGSKKFLSASMMKGEASNFTATIPETAMATEVEYFIEAYDVNGNGPARFASDKAPHKIKLTTKAEPAKVAEPTPEPKPAETKPAETRPSEPAVAKPERVLPPKPVVVAQAEPLFGPMRIAGVAVGAVGIAGIVVGAVLGSSAQTLRSQAVQDPNASSAVSKFNSAKSNALGANIAYVAGGVLVAAGVVLAIVPIFTSSSAQHSSLQVGPTGATYTLTF
jgi:hypothetical protein